MRSEAELLRWCAGLRRDAGEIRALLEGPLDWGWALGMAEAHGLLPLVYWRVKEAGAEAAPGAALERLAARFRANAARSLFLTAELLKILERLEAGGVAVIPFKGPVLAWWVYPHPALREFGDLDILVRARDVGKARELLGSEGYRPRFAVPGAIEQRFAEGGRQMVLTRLGGEVNVDLHWGMWARSSGLPEDFEGWWERRAAVPVAGRQVRTFGPEDSLVLLCLHGVKHCWSSLGGLADIAALIASCAMDWDQVMAQAARLRLTRMLHVGIALASKVLGCGVPGEVLKRAQADGRAQALAAQAGDALFADPPGIAAGRECTLFLLRSMERLRDRVRFYLGMLFEPTQADWEALRLPAWLFPAYYLARPVRLVLKHGRAFTVRTVVGRRGRRG